MNTPPARRPLALALAAACWLAAGTALAQPSEPAPDGRAGAPAWPTAAASPPAPDPECASAPESIDWASAQRRLARCNRDLRVALRATESALADVRVAGQRPNPTLSAGIGNVNPQLGLGGATNPLDYPLDYIARLDQTFERGGKRGLRIESAEA
ncbi:MAG: hypothetical protein ACK54X_21410, partial [Burkholderiales bacterium]